MFVFCLRQYSVLCAEYFEVDAFPNKVIERPSSTSSSRRLLTNQKLQKTNKNCHTVGWKISRLR